LLSTHPYKECTLKTLETNITLIWAKLDGSGVGFAVGMITATVILALYWWFFRMMVHKVVDATYDKATERTDSSKFRTIDCMKLKNDYTLKYYSYAITVML
jgi:hypothetical protein